MGDILASDRNPPTRIFLVMILDLKDKIWNLTWTAWVAAAVMIATFYWNLAVGYSWTLPIIGTVKGPPTEKEQVVFFSIFLISLIVGSGATGIVLGKGHMKQRLICIPPTFLFVAVLAALIYQITQ